MLNNATATPQGFSALNLIDPLCRAVHAQGYTVPTPIQNQAIPPLLEGRDLLGCAQTGTGKTAAFALPILQRLASNKNHPGPRGVRALILAPTRELAVQISDSFGEYGRYLKMTQALVFGGVKPGPQIKALSRGVDILVATPGRLLDLMNQGFIKLDNVEVFVLDEGDRMLDMGFLPDMRKIRGKVPAKRQTMLFSATFPNEVMRLTEEFLNSPVTVTVTPPKVMVENIDQRIHFVDRENKAALLESFMQNEPTSRTLVFTRTKHGANRVANNLRKIGVMAGIIHGNKSQSARLQALATFRSGKASVLVATDIAARGLDIHGITHVINYDLPIEAESYIHRIGRTGRAGAEGIAISYCDAGERGYLRQIERQINRSVTVDADHPFHSTKVESAQGDVPRKSRNGGGGNRKPGNGRSRARRPQHGSKKSGGATVVFSSRNRR